MNLSRIPALLLGFLLLAPLTLRAGEEDLKALYDAARAAEAARDYRTALAKYDEIIDADEDYEDAFERWDACIRPAEWQEELEGEAKAIDLVRLGEIFQELGRTADERAAYRDAVKMDPSCSEAHGHLALQSYTTAPVDMDVVIGETLAFLRTSPYREHLARAIADFEVYGELRRMEIRMAGVLGAMNAVEEKDPKKAASILLKAAKREDIPDVYRTALFTWAGRLLVSVDDPAGARAAFEESLRHAACQITVSALLDLAALDAGEGKVQAGLAHLRAAVAEGSRACTWIAARKETDFRAIAEAHPAEMAKLCDPRAADAPIRKAIADACAKAGKEGKKVLLEWYGPYCPYVMAMEERLAHPEVRKVLAEKYVHVRMDQGTMHRGITLDAEYGDVMRTWGVPCFFVLDPDGTVAVTQPDVDLFAAPNRAYDPEKIAAFLVEASEE